MTVEITYFVHGTTIDNEQHISSGWKDVELSHLGTQQSKDLPVQNPALFDVVFCSDLKRAVSSAEISFGGKCPIISDARLRECNYGEYNGKSSELVEPMQQRMINERFPGGESYEDVRRRIEEFLKDVKRDYDGKRVAIVAHKAPQLALEVIVNHKSWQQAFDTDWRMYGKWQPGWRYDIE